jgi:hypothetical protein
MDWVKQNIRRAFALRMYFFVYLLAVLADGHCVLYRTAVSRSGVDKPYFLL